MLYLVRSLTFNLYTFVYMQQRQQKRKYGNFECILKMNVWKLAFLFIEMSTLATF